MMSLRAHPGDRDPDLLGPAVLGRRAGTRQRGHPRHRRPGHPLAAVELIEVLRLPVVAGAGGDRQHLMAGARPPQRPVGLVPVEPVDPDLDQRPRPGAVVDPRPVGVDPRRHQAADHAGQRRHRQRGGDALAPEPLAPHERGQQREQDQTLQIGELRADQRGGHDGQRQQRQRRGGPPPVAEGPPPSRQGHHRRAVEQQHGRAEHDHEPNRVAGAQVGHEHVGQRLQSVLDPARADGDPQVHHPVPAQPRHRKRRQQQSDQQHDGQDAAVAAQHRHAAGHGDPEREQAQQPPGRRVAHQRAPPL